MQKYKNEAYAATTRKAYNTHRKTYLLFCERLGYCPVPATTDIICRYSAFLARSLKFNSIKQYLNIVRILHREWNLPNPLESNYHVDCVLKGIRRSLGDNVTQKCPMTPQLLKGILRHLNLANPSDACIWAISLILFFGLLRKGSVLPSSGSYTSDHKVLCRSDIKFFPWGMCLYVRHTKTIQYQQRILQIPMPRYRNSVLCPVQATYQAFRLTPTVASNAPAFCVLTQKGTQPITGQQFVRRIKECIQKCGLSSENYAAHSFRRGGATWAYRVGLPAETIRIMGDWRSTAYLKYIDVGPTSIMKAISHMQSNI